MVSDTVALSVLRICADASTLTVSVTPPDLQAGVGAHDLIDATSTPVALKFWKPGIVTVMSYLPVRTNWMW